MQRRRRGTALVDTPNGVLLVSQNGRRFILPGGGARRGETREGAAIRELEEETGLKAVDSTFLFEHVGPTHRGYGGGYYRDCHKVFLITSAGVAKPRKEIKALAYYGTADISLSTATKDIIEKYQKVKRPSFGYTALTCSRCSAPLKLKEHMTFIECDHCGQQYYKGIFLQA